MYMYMYSMFTLTLFRLVFLVKVLLAVCLRTLKIHLVIWLKQVACICELHPVAARTVLISIGRIRWRLRLVDWNISMFKHPIPR